MFVRQDQKRYTQKKEVIYNEISEMLTLTVSSQRSKNDKNELY